jgi:hypothetical protein
MVAHALQTSTGEWQWLENQSIGFFMNTAVVRGDITQAGSLFALLVGFNNCGEWEATTRDGEPPAGDFGRAGTMVQNLGLGDPVVRRLGLGAVETLVPTNIFFPPHCDP